MKVLCVAEKPSIAKAIAQALGGGRVTTRNIRGNRFVKNYDIAYTFRQWGPCEVTVTSVSGHLQQQDFDKQRYGWRSCEPRELLFERAVIDTTVADAMKPVANNIKSEARIADKLYIWTDCDREGEYIGAEIIKVAREGNRRMNVEDIKRATFNNTDHGHLRQAANQPGDLDQRQVDAVQARIELDLRAGAAYTRFQTFLLQRLPQLKDKMVSYGGCQFPTLGFVVDRFKKVRDFKPENFWYIEVKFERDDNKVTFNWERSRLYDHLAALALFERCLDTTYQARVVKVDVSDTKRQRPLPLTTVDLQKQGARWLRMTPKKVLDVAEKLYQHGYLSYPRTETNVFAPEIDLMGLIRKHEGDRQWGDYVEMLLNGDQFQQPRKGRKDDKAHPPIHPVNTIPDTLDADSKKVYEFVTRHFLACCGKDALGKQTKVTIGWAGERFTATGVRVLERNFLLVYPYIKWDTNELCEFTQGEMIQLSDTNLNEGQTSPPQYMTEPELIAMMDANGIGTDATMADHIEKIVEREYVAKHARGRGNNAVTYMIPSALGMALVEAYDAMDFDLSLTKPFLRKDTEQKLQMICEGRLSRQEFVRDSLDTYRRTFELANRHSRDLFNTTQRLIRQNA